MGRRQGYTPDEAIAKLPSAATSLALGVGLTRRLFAQAQDASHTRIIGNYIVTSGKRAM